MASDHYETLGVPNGAVPDSRGPRHHCRRPSTGWPQQTAGEMKRITRPESVLTLDDVDRHKVTTALGKELLKR